MVLALDQALKTTGYAFFNDKQLVESGTFTVPPSESIELRLKCFIDNLNKLCKKHQINKIYFEDIQNQQNNETYKKLAYVQAAIILWCAYQDYDFKILGPSHWRSVLKTSMDGLGFGRTRVEQKKQAIELVKRVFNKEVSSDEADAICLGYAGMLEEPKNISAF